MRRFHPCAAGITFLLLQAIPLHAAQPAAEAAKPDRLPGIIKAVRAQEQRYRNLETVVRRMTTIPKEHSDGWRFTKSDEVYRTVLQGNLLYFAGEDKKQTLTGETVTVKRLSAYDGEITTSIEYGNSVNIHERRYEPSQLFPPHCWAIFHLDVNFPLSVYLAGTEAMKDHPKVCRYPREYGFGYVFNRVECEFLKEEVVGELNCLKIRCKRWYRSKNLSSNRHSHFRESA